MSDEKIRLKDLLKDAIPSVEVAGFAEKWKKDAFVYSDQDEEVAQVGFAFVGPKHSAQGALFGVYVGGFANGGNIGALVNGLSISYPARDLPKQCFYRASLEDKGANAADLLKSGVLPVFPGDDLTLVSDRLMTYATQEMVRDVKLFLTNAPSLIDTILTNPERYRYPVVQIIYSAITNSIEFDESLRKRLKNSKAYGSGDQQVEEAIFYVREYLKHGVRQ